WEQPLLSLKGGPSTTDGRGISGWRFLQRQSCRRCVRRSPLFVASPPCAPEEDADRPTFPAPRQEISVPFFFKIIPEYQRIVRFMLGRYAGAPRGPGRGLR